MEKKKVVSSLLYRFTESFAVKGLGLVISIILARLLSPDEFGQVAIIMVFINLCQTFVQSGLGTALVQNKTADHKDYSTVFYISLSIAALSIAVLWIGAPFIGAYYENDAIVLPLRVYAFSLIFAAFNSVQMAKLQREMRFKQSMVRGLVTTVLSGVIGVVAAMKGLGIWALIVYYSANTVISCLTLFWAVKWRPKWEFSVARAKELFAYGWKMLVSAVLCSVYNDIRTLIIGKRFSEGDLAYYNRGDQFPSVISNTLDTATQSVMFPVLSKEQEHAEKLRVILKRTVVLGSLLIIPTMLGLAMVSESVILLLLTEKWLPSVVFMQFLCIGHASLPIASSLLIAIKASGRSDVYMRLEMVRRVVMLVVLLISIFAFRSVKAIAVGYAVSAWLDVVVISFATKRLFGYGILEQLRDIWKILLASVLMSVAMGGLGVVLSGFAIPVLLVLALQVSVGIAVYLGSCLLLREEGLFFLIEQVRKLIGKKAKTGGN